MRVDNFKKQLNAVVLRLFSIVILGLGILGLIYFASPTIKAQEQDQQAASVTEEKKTSPIVTAFKVAKVVWQALQGSFTSTVVEGTGNSLLGYLTSMSGILNGVPTAQLEALKYSNPALYQKYMATVPPEMRHGVVGFTAQYTLGVLESPMHINTTEFYAQNFVPASVREAVSPVSQEQVYAGTVLTLGTPPLKTNAFQLLSPVVGKLWLGMFKMVSGLFVIVLLVAGIMMIINYKIKGQTPVSVYLVLRNLVIGYIGAILSFGIGAFFINLSKFLILLVVDMFISMYAGGGATTKNVNPVTMFQLLMGGVDGVVIYPGTILGPWYYGLFMAYYNVMGGLAVAMSTWGQGLGSGDIFSGIINTLGSITGLAIAPLWGMIFGVFYAIALLISLIKLFVFIIRNYLSMIFGIVFAPLTFVAGVLPGQDHLITEWFKKMFARAVSPAVAYFFVNVGVAFLIAPEVNSQILQGHNSFEVFTGGAIQSPFFNLGNMMVMLTPLAGIVFLVTVNIAAQADKLVDEWFQVKQSSPVIQTALAKVPIIGRFGGAKK